MIKPHAFARHSVPPDLFRAVGQGEAAVAAWVMARYERADEDMRQELALAAVLSLRASHAHGLDSDTACRHILAKLRYTRLEYRRQLYGRTGRVAKRAALELDAPDKRGRPTWQALEALKEMPRIDGEVCSLLRAAMTALRPPEVEVVQRLYGIGHDPQSLVEQAQALGLSPQRLHQRLKQAHARLRTSTKFRELGGDFAVDSEQSSVWVP